MVGCQAFVALSWNAPGATATASIEICPPYRDVVEGMFKNRWDILYGLLNRVFRWDVLSTFTAISMRFLWDLNADLFPFTKIIIVKHFNYHNIFWLSLINNTGLRFKTFFHKVWGLSAVYIQVECAETENAIHFSRLARVFQLYHFKVGNLRFWLLCTPKNTYDFTRC